MGDWNGNDKTPQLPDGLTRMKKIGQRTPGSETSSCRAGDKRPRHQQTVPQSLSQQWIPSATNVEVSGTMRHSALVEEEEEERRETRERRASTEGSSSSRKDSGQAKGQAQDQGQRERVVRKMDAGRVAGRILGTSARRDRLAAKVVRQDTLESSRLELLEVYVQWERA